MNVRNTVIAYALVGASALFVGCAGGGGSSSTPAAAQKSGGSANTTFTIAIPGPSTGTSSNARKPAYISSGTQSIGIAVALANATPGPATYTNLTPTSPGCSGSPTTTGGFTCSVSFTAPVGNDTFYVSTYSGAAGAGSVLSSGMLGETIVAGNTNNFPLTLDGVVAGIIVTVTNGNAVIPGGYATTLPVLVTAKDASGAVIIGPAPYATPITLTNADTSGVTTLSTTSVTSPATTVTLAYAPTDTNTGVLNVTGMPIGSTQISATYPGVAASAIVPGTFQYLLDRFPGFNGNRVLTGSATVTITTYNAMGMPSPNPSVFSYTLSHTFSLHSGATFNGVTGNVTDAHHVETITQIAPAPTVSAEVRTLDEYRHIALTHDGQNSPLYLLGQVYGYINSLPTTSPFTGAVAGDSVETDTYPATGAWKDDILPEIANQAWPNSNIPFTETYTGAQASTFTLNADDSLSFSETIPNTHNYTTTAAGTSSVFNPTGVTVTISTPIPNPSPGGTGLVIPVAEETTSPAPGPTATSYAIDWYPAEMAPPQPSYVFFNTGTPVTIPAACNVPASVATTAYAITYTKNLTDIANFKATMDTKVDYFAPNGVGWVCETQNNTVTGYHTASGTTASQSILTSVIGVTTPATLNLRRTH